jgi:divalent metal cation (Fe/Co/Zn/Cd) transporter
VDGVLVVERVRTRSAGAGTFIDLIVGVPRTLPFHQVHSISEQIEEAVLARIPRADVVVHMEPRAAGDETFYDKVRAIAQRNNLHVHELSAHDVKEGEGGKGSLILDLDVEVDVTLTLREAHALADRVEKEIYRELPQVSQINTHIETLEQEIAPGEELDGLARALEAHLANAPAHFPDLQDCHDIQVRSVDGKVVVSFHAVSDGSLPITRVHDITQQLEAHIHRRFPQIFRLTIHTEPPEER